MIEGWKRTSIGEIGHVVTGTTPPTTNSEYYGGDIPFVAPGDLGKNLFVNFTERTLTAEGLAKAKALPAGAVLFTCIGATIGKSAIAGRELATNQQVNAVICSPQKADSTFVYYLLNMRAEQIKRLAGAQAVPIVNKSTFEDVTAPFPPLSEQRKIAEILRTWDDALEKLEALRDAGVSRKKGILQCLFGDGIQFQDRWDAKSLKDISERVRRTNDGGDHPIMTISAKGGFLLQSDKFARDMAGSSVDRYTQIKQGEFAYNKGNSKTAPYGCIFALDRPTAVVPFVYFCFKLDDDLHHPFFVHLFEAGVLNHQLSRLINSGVRNDGLLNLYAEDFFNCRVPVPPHDEQVRIANIITSLNSELTLVEEEIAVVQRQKRGLMQKLLTGEWRVAHSQDQTENIGKEAAHG